MCSAQIGGMRSYGINAEVEQKVQTLLHYKWARAVWEAEMPNAQKAYNDWVHHRSFP